MLIQGAAATLLRNSSSRSNRAVVSCGDPGRGNVIAESTRCACLSKESGERQSRGGPRSGLAHEIEPVRLVGGRVACPRRSDTADSDQQQGQSDFAADLGSTLPHSSQPRDWMSAALPFPRLQPAKPAFARAEPLFGANSERPRKGGQSLLGRRVCGRLRSLLLPSNSGDGRAAFF